MDLLATIINTVLLLALFWYQRNKNKVLNDRIDHQSKLMQETKDVVSNQAQAIESQKKVVDSALEYSEKFDLKKLEDVLKRELELEYKETIKEQNDKIIEHEKKSNEAEKNAIKYAAKVTSEHVASEYILPLAGELFSLLVFSSPEKRNEVLANIPEGIAETFKRRLDDFDKTNPLAMIANTLKANKSSNTDADGAGS